MTEEQKTPGELIEEYLEQCANNWDAYAENPLITNVWSYDRASKFILSLILKEVEGIENPHEGGINTEEYFKGIGFDEAITAVKKRMGGK